jgi:hypothetical protein
MKDSHPKDYNMYVVNLKEILSDPTYISKHPHNGSIEYVKVYPNADTNEEHVMVAVRVSGNGNYFARTLFVMSKEKVKIYKEKGFFLEY